MSSSSAERNAGVVNHEGETQPKRVLGFRDLVLFYIVTSLSLRWIAVAASTGPSTLVIWVIGLLTIFIPLAFCVMELSSRYPEEGGMYVWSKQAFGDFSGFMTGWIYWTSNLPYFPAVLYFAASNAVYVGGRRWSHLEGSQGFFITFSLLGLALALVVNIVGLDVGKWLSNVGAIGTWVPVVMLCTIAVVAWHRFGSATSFDLPSLKPALTMGSAGIWATLLYGFAGAESASFMGGEIKSARRIIPPALIVAGALIALGYMLGTISVLVTLPHEQVGYMAGITQAISSAAERVGWIGLGPAMALLICVANLGAVSAFLAALARIPFVAGIDRYLPPAFGRVHPKWKTPHIALIVQAACCVLFVLLGQMGSTVRGAYEVLVSMSIICNFIPYLFMFAALIKLQSVPVGKEVVRVPGGKPAAIGAAVVGWVTTFAVIVGSVIPDPSEPHKVLAIVKIILLSLVVLVGGMLLYMIGKKRAIAAVGEPVADATSR